MICQIFSPDSSSQVRGDPVASRSDRSRSFRSIHVCAPALLSESTSKMVHRPVFHERLEDIHTTGVAGSNLRV